ncbi:MAG: sporulation initiation factor Spo0A C-terminal domain-containing protein [Clostridia bacterium]|nr:sporulation initiation factor Spo0A C-terminal domain-containing protein [Clostridia bacterium]
MDDGQLSQNITNLLMSFKVQPDIMGFEYLRTAVMLCYVDENLKNNISKKLYPMVAERCNSTAETVERGIRTAVENCFNCGGLLEINEKCGMVVYKNNFKWTNGEVISTLTELLRLDDVRRNLKLKLNQLKR